MAACVLRPAESQAVGHAQVGGDPRRIAFSRAGKIGAITNAAGYLTFIK
jgi:hypothetical protein